MIPLTPIESIALCLASVLSVSLLYRRVPDEPDAADAKQDEIDQRVLADVRSRYAKPFTHTDR